MDFFPSTQTQSKMIVVREGIPIIIALVLAGVFVSFIPITFFRLLGLIFFSLGIFSCFFFRDPPRNIIADPSFVVAPADGRVLEVVEEFHPDMTEKSKVIRIFLSIFNVHIQRSPIAGKITKVEYKKGKFLDARNPRAAFENESNSFVIENEYDRVVVKQIAGFIARRIVRWAHAEQTVQIGQKIGLIRFGSQVDVFLPPEMELCVEKGDRLLAGVSMIAFHKRRIQSQARELTEAVR